MPDRDPAFSKTGGGRRGIDPISSGLAPLPVHLNRLLVSDPPVAARYCNNPPRPQHIVTRRRVGANHRAFQFGRFRT